ncbi:uncharacterized protein LOC125902267 isoform X2 [Epinephelus fuscoguttatus]|uniref:uncharacterized protein LOC125902267 isoform X2 n=1 Tax=Epinephelus fuscoguttatus TaxID=293821 RepID=UPI0020D02D99|nr:uncharacterized protein LOC125902267 isoform X2 [Epinephelus fuscoguttatus]
MQSRLRSGFKSVCSRSKSNGAEETQRTKTYVRLRPVISPPNYWNSKTRVCIKRLADTVKEKSTLLKPQTGSLPVYKVPLKEEQISVSGCKKFSFGEESTKLNRTIMVLGTTGAGTSTLLNGMINYILGVQWEDSFRFKLVDEGQSKSQAHSQTSDITVYKLNHQKGFKIEHSLTIVDTPGFGDTRGIERDKQITEQLHNLFSAELGVSEIDAVCIVAQAALTQLTPSQKFAFESVLSIFGKDIAENIQVLVTFADGQKPPVLEAISASGIPCPERKDGLPIHFKFNNSALFADSKSSAADSMSEDDENGDESFDQMFWNMGTKSMRTFFVALDVMDTKSLTMTKEVLRERQRLEKAVENLQKQVKVGLAKLDETTEKAETLKEHEAEMGRYKNFEFESSFLEAIQVHITGTGIYLNNCKQCHFTCHSPCRRSNNTGDKRHCKAIGSDGRCTKCPGKCNWDEHNDQTYKWESEELKEVTTVKERKKKYRNAKDIKKCYQTWIEKLMHEYQPVQAEVEALRARYNKSLNRLKKIALKPNPLYACEFIDMLIEAEKSEAKPGWRQRVQPLITMREKADIMAKVDRGEILLPSPPIDLQCSSPSHDITETDSKRPRLK